MGNKASTPEQPRLFSQGPIRAEAYNERQDEPDDPEEQVFFNKISASELFKRLAQKDPELNAISGPNVWLIMEQARAWTKYTNTSTRKLLMIFCKPDETYPRGRISWGHDRMYPDGTFDLKDLSTIWIGKRRGPFLTPIAQHADEDRCVTLIGTNGFTMHVEAPSRGVLTLWLFGLNFALTASGHDAFIGLNTQSLQVSLVQPGQTSTMGGHIGLSKGLGIGNSPLLSSRPRRKSVDGGTPLLSLDTTDTTTEAGRRRRSSIDGRRGSIDGLSGLASPHMMGGVGAANATSTAQPSAPDLLTEEEAVALLAKEDKEVPPPSLGFLVSEEVLFAARDPQILLRTLETGFLLSCWTLGEPIPSELYRRRATEVARNEDPFGGVSLEQVSMEPTPKRSSLKGARRASLLNQTGLGNNTSQGGSAVGQTSVGGAVTADRNIPALRTIIPSEYGDLARIGRPGQLAFPVPAALSYNPKTDTLHLRSQVNDLPAVQRLRHQHFQMYHTQQHQHHILQLQHHQWEDSIQLADIDQIVLGKATAELLSTHCVGLSKSVCVTIVAGERVWNLTADTHNLMNNMLCALNLLFTEHDPKLLIYDDPNLPEGDVDKSFWIISERMHNIAREKDKIPRFVEYALHAPQVTPTLTLNAFKRGFNVLRPTKPQRSREALDYGHDEDVIVKNKVVLWGTVDARRAKAMACSLHWAVYPASARRPEETLLLADVGAIVCGKSEGMLKHPQCRNLPDACCATLVDENGRPLLDVCFESAVGENSRAAFLVAIDTMLHQTGQALLAPLPAALQTPKPDPALYAEDGLPKSFVCNIVSMEAAAKEKEAL